MDIRENVENPEEDIGYNNTLDKIDDYLYGVLTKRIKREVSINSGRARRHRDDVPLQNYLKNVNYTFAILKLYLNDKNLFMTIQNIIPKSFYTELFSCKNIFTNVTIQGINNKFIENLEILKNMQQRMYRDVTLHYLVEQLDPHIIQDDVIELTKNYVNIEAYVEYKNVIQNDGVTIKTPVYKMRIFDKKRKEPVWSIYGNRDKKARFLWDSYGTKEYEQGMKVRREYRIKDQIRIDNEVRLYNVPIVDNIIEDEIINNMNEDFVENEDINDHISAIERRLCRHQDDLDTQICSKCHRNTMRGKCININCDKYTEPTIIRCDQCIQFRRSNRYSFLTNAII